MKAYLLTTGAVFVLVTAAHVWRMFEEGAHVAGDPWFLALTAVTAAFSIWAWRLLRSLSRA